MSITKQLNVEPIPGYRLVKRLGGGGFAEVWQCEAPGGLVKALKFVHGNLNAIGTEGSLAEQELRALHRVKAIRHPFILSMERVEIIGGELVIVMELADKNLENRLIECQAIGLEGIPREELLAYMRDAAEALDLMNFQHDLQHLDVKPRNLFLVGNRLKVADFGLVQCLEGLAARSPNSGLRGEFTPHYAAPEVFEGV
ncbi:MAG TPA: protein kinase, partial [Gemmataceae bacterium]